MEFLVSAGNKEFNFENSNERLKINGLINTSEIIKLDEKTFSINNKEGDFVVDIIKFDEFSKTLITLVNGKRVDLSIKDKNDLLLKKLGLDNVNTNKFNELKSPMPGMVLDIKVSEGQEIKKGDPIIVLEAMKMENILKAPADVTVKSIHAKKGTAVEKNQILVKFS